MERTEPTLVPGWLKSTGSVSGGGNAIQQSGSSSSHSDDHVNALPTRNRSSISVGDYDSSRSSAFLDRTTSSYLNRSLNSNGSVMHEKDFQRSYSSFGRNHRDRSRDKNLIDSWEKEESIQCDHNYSIPLGSSPNFLSSRIENNKLRRSQTMISGKRGEMLPRRVVADLNSGTGSNNNNHISNNCVSVGGSTIGSFHNAAFKRDFPSLGAEERQGADISRVSSPGLSTAVQSLPIGTLPLIGGDGWISALAEVPVIIGSNSMGLSSGQLSAPASSATMAPSTTAGLNMAETLAQAPSRVHTPPQLSIETQRLEELAIRQSRQLIPMTPSMSKTSVLNSEKAKAKVASRSEMNLASKIGHQQQLPSSQLVNHSLHSGAARSDVVKSLQVGKLQVLKGMREKNGISPTAKDGSSPTNAGKVVNNSFAVAPSATFVPPLKGPNNPKLTASERRVAAFPATMTSSMEKRPTMSQAQSRNDFFNLMRKKTSTSSAAPDLNPVSPSTVLDNSGELIKEVAPVPVCSQGNESPVSDPALLDWSTESTVNIVSNGDACEDARRYPNNGEKILDPFEAVYADEKEIAFLRSLGWEENAEEEALTEEEINDFYNKYMKLKPSSKVC